MQHSNFNPSLPGYENPAQPTYIIPQPTDFGPAPGWTELELPPWNLGNSSFIDCDSQNERLRVRLFIRENDKRLIAKAWFGPQAEGPPGHAHGGSMAAVLDHVMGFSAWVAGHPVVARKIAVEFHRKLPLGTVALAEAWVSDVQDKKSPQKAASTTARRKTSSLHQTDCSSSSRLINSKRSWKPTPA